MMDDPVGTLIRVGTGLIICSTIGFGVLLLTLSA